MGYSQDILLGGGDFAAETYGKNGIGVISSGVKGMINKSDSEEDKKCIMQGISWANCSIHCK